MQRRTLQKQRSNTANSTAARAAVINEHHGTRTHSSKIGMVISDYTTQNKSCCACTWASFKLKSISIISATSAVIAECYIL